MPRSKISPKAFRPLPNPSPWAKSLRILAFSNHETRAFHLQRRPVRLMPMTYRGGCHCGRVAFEADGDLTAAVDCNCSICTKSGFLHWRIEREQLRMLTPWDRLSSLYLGHRQGAPLFLSGVRSGYGARAAPQPQPVHGKHPMSGRCRSVHDRAHPVRRPRLGTGISAGSCATNRRGHAVIGRRGNLARPAAIK